MQPALASKEVPLYKEFHQQKETSVFLCHLARGLPFSGHLSYSFYTLRIRQGKAAGSIYDCSVKRSTELSCRPRAVCLHLPAELSASSLTACSPRRDVLILLTFGPLPPWALRGDRSRGGGRALGLRSHLAQGSNTTPPHDLDSVP